MYVLIDFCIYDKCCVVSYLFVSFVMYLFRELVIALFLSVFL